MMEPSTILAGSATTSSRVGSRPAGVGRRLSNTGVIAGWPGTKYGCTLWTRRTPLTDANAGLVA